MRKSPTVSLYACGGCGINNLKSILASKAKTSYPLTSIAIDTSDSNLHGLPETVKMKKIADLGAGKLRKEFAAKINQKLTNANVLGEASDINLIMFSLAGGSGSLIAPLLAYALVKANKNVVLLCVGDASSRVDVDNTINTIKTISGLASKNDCYFPIVFCQNDDGRKAADAAIVANVKAIRELIGDQSITELDHSDMMNFFNPRRVNSNLKGAYRFGITHTKPSEPSGEVSFVVKPTDVLHTMMSINPDGKVSAGMPMASYVGISEKNNITAVVGYPLPIGWFDALEAKQQLFDLSHEKHIEHDDLFAGRSISEDIII